MPSCHAMFGFEKPRWHYISEFGTGTDRRSERLYGPLLLPGRGQPRIGPYSSPNPQAEAGLRGAP